MFNPNRIETIRKNIQSSTLLSDHEKSDWLSLLDLMNDKQLGELEEILAAEPAKPVDVAPPTPAQTPSPAPMPVQVNMPPLSHIANVPTDVNMTRVNPGMMPTPTPQHVQAPRPAPAQQSTPTKPKTSIVNLPRTEFEPLSIRPTPSPNLSQSAPAAQSAPAPAQPPRPAAPARDQQSVSQPVTQSQAPFNIEQVEDLQNLSLESLRTFSHQSIADAVRTAITEHGYFAILELVESSKLYADYISAGKERLGMRSASGAEIQSGFTQEEFEFMVDLLRSMRFNRW